MTDVALREESQFFQEHVNDWFGEKDKAGKWALIKGHELLGVYDTFDAAVKAGFKRFGAHPFFVSEIDPNANELTTTSLMLGSYLAATSC